MKKLNCILLVDDNDAENYYYKRMIKAADLASEIKEAENGVMALDYIMNSAKGDQPKEYPKPELILLDINMPLMNGFEFLDQYNKLNEVIKTGTVLLMVTTSKYPEDMERAKLYKELKGYIIKPLNKEMLQQVIEQHCN